jgi:hypothetical protein
MSNRIIKCSIAQEVFKGRLIACTKSISVEPFSSKTMTKIYRVFIGASQRVCANYYGSQPFTVWWGIPLVGYRMPWW